MHVQQYYLENPLSMIYMEYVLNFINSDILYERSFECTVH